LIGFGKELFLVGVRDRARRLAEIFTPHALVFSYHRIGRVAPDPLHVSAAEELFAA
jgi:hypothetical protein